VEITIIILAIVFVLIAVRQVGNIKLQIWQIMSGGALLVLLTHQISILNALKAINLNVLIFLFSMFILGVSLEESGYLSHITYKIFKSAKNINHLILLIIFVMGISAAFLMNDTVAIIGTGIILLLAKKHEISPKILLITLALAITTGSVMSPIGNPQNFLIATEGHIINPFIEFLKFLFIPTIINLFIVFFIIKIFYKDHFNKKDINPFSQEPIKDHNLAMLSRISLILLACLILINIIISLLRLPININLIYITTFSILPIVIFSKKRVHIIKKVDWHTLIFFAAMFVLMKSVWNSGFFQSVINNLHINILSNPAVLSISVILSQLISNVPLVALYMPMLLHKGISTNGMMALAAGSTIAGNLLILGAASNIIIIHNAEKKSRETITFGEFARIGIPLTLINILIYYLFLTVIH
jgi:Na+/H+ antiporter NhaD/arsenite permease-like protein